MHFLLLFRNKMILKNICLVFYSLFILSCLDQSGEDPPTSGEAFFTTKNEDGKFSAFSFSEGKVIKYPNTQGLNPDIMLMVHTNENGIPIGVFLVSLELKPTFSYKFWSSSIDSSQNYFDNLLVIPDTIFTGLALPIKENQVWAVVTNGSRFGKILIKNTTAYIDSSDIHQLTPYGEVRFKWEYQPDGSNIF